MFCPANTIMAAPKENNGMMTNPSIRIAMMFEAISTSPKLLISHCIITIATEKTAWDAPVGRPRRVN
jgi:hypothetical protein